MTPWILNEHERTDPDTWNSVLHLEWCQNVTGGRLTHAITLRPTEYAGTLPEEVLHRLLCHAIVARLNESALSEAAESLAGIYEYYRTLPQVQPPALPASGSVAVKWGNTSERPIFHIDER